MNMKEAFDIYFERQRLFWLEKFKTYPKVPLNLRLSKGIEPLIVAGTSVDSDGYVQWQPKLQSKSVDFVNLEEELGFKIHSDIKDYFSTYYFLEMIGRLDINECASIPFVRNITTSNISGENTQYIDFYFNKIPFSSEITTLIKGCYVADNNCYKREIDNIKNIPIFEIGFITIKGNDSNSLCVSNETGEIICVQFQEKRAINTFLTITELLKIMKVGM